MKRIPLSQGEFALVDDEDYEKLSKHKWTLLLQKNSRKYAYRQVGKLGVDRRNIRMHRVIMNAAEDTEVDHRDGNGLNNQKSNLRICSHQNNMRNMNRVVNKSGYKGVRVHPERLEKGRRAYQSTIWDGSKSVSLGYYETPLEAATAYNNKALELFGEFARLNPI